jgi:hypothetical protein
MRRHRVVLLALSVAMALTACQRRQGPDLRPVTGLPFITPTQEPGIGRSSLPATHAPDKDPTGTHDGTLPGSETAWLPSAPTAAPDPEPSQPTPSPPTSVDPVFDEVDGALDDLEWALQGLEMWDVDVPLAGR